MQAFAEGRHGAARSLPVRGGAQAALGWLRLAPGRSRLAPGRSRLALGWLRLAPGWSRLAPGWLRLLPGTCSGGRLRTRTASRHDRLEWLANFQALHAGELCKPAIVSFLRGLLDHARGARAGTLQVRRPVPSGSAALARPKIPPLLADLDVIGAQRDPSVTRRSCGLLTLARRCLPARSIPGVPLALCLFWTDCRTADRPAGRLMPNACASAKRWTIRREAGDGFGNPGAI